MTITTKEKTRAYFLSEKVKLFRLRDVISELKILTEFLSAHKRHLKEGTGIILGGEVGVQINVNKESNILGSQYVSLPDQYESRDSMSQKY